MENEIKIEDKKPFCVICFGQINKNKDNYFKVELHRQINLIGTDYVHEICWNKRMKMKTDKKINQLVDGVHNYASKMGIIPDKELILV